jgi:hypothetical protein
MFVSLPPQSPRTFRAIRAQNTDSRSPIIAYTSLPSFETDAELECHDWPRTTPLPPSDDGSWLSLFGLAQDWQEV